MKRLFNWAFHPFLFALYPPLYLFVHNIEELGLENILRTILASLLLAGLALALFRLAFKGWQKAALLATILVLAFYTYAPIFDRVNKLSVAGILIGRHRILVAVYALIFIFGVYLVLKKSVDFNLITNGLNLVSFVLVMFLLGQITMYLVKTTEANAPQNIVSIKDQLNPPAKSALPDIYYILIDTYARDDVILKDYHYDNSQFIADLKARGFYVPECSRSNFTRTELSISTALNLDYVQNFAANMLDVHATDAARMAVYVVNNKVKATLQSLGYKTIAFQTDYNRMDMTSADIFYALPKSRHNSQILY